jgi:hypothetical protein
MLIVPRPIDRQNGHAACHRDRSEIQLWSASDRRFHRFFRADFNANSTGLLLSGETVAVRIDEVWSE